MPGAKTTLLARLPERRRRRRGGEPDAIRSNGSSLPDQIGDAVAGVAEQLGPAVSWESTRTTMPSAASPTRSPRVRAGARLVQGTVNGYGERCGNANLVSILPALQLKMDCDVVEPEQLSGLSQTSHYVAELLNVSVDPDQAYVGEDAFAHKGGCTWQASQPTLVPSSIWNPSRSETHVRCFLQSSPAKPRSSPGRRKSTSSSMMRRRPKPSPGSQGARTRGVPLPGRRGVVDLLLAARR